MLLWERSLKLCKSTLGVIRVGLGISVSISFNKLNTPAMVETRELWTKTLFVVKAFCLSIKANVRRTIIYSLTKLLCTLVLQWISTFIVKTPKLRKKSYGLLPVSRKSLRNRIYLEYSVRSNDSEYLKPEKTSSKTIHNSFGWHDINTVSVYTQWRPSMFALTLYILGLCPYTLFWAIPPYANMQYEQWNSVALNPHHYSI